MTMKDYSELLLVEKPAIELFQTLGWEALDCYHETFGEQGLLEKQERSATVTATSELRLIKIEHWELSRMRKAMPEVVERLQQRVEGFEN